MTKARLLAFPLSLALALAGAAAVVAQDDEPEAEAGPVMEQGMFAYGWLQTWFAETGVDPEEGMAELEEWYGSLGDEDVEDLAEFYLASEGVSAIMDELGDGSFSPFSDEDESEDMDEASEDMDDDESDEEESE